MLGERQSGNLYFHDNVIVLDDSDQSWVGASLDQDPRVFDSNNRFQSNTYHGNGKRGKLVGVGLRYPYMDAMANAWLRHGGFLLATMR